MPFPLSDRLAFGPKSTDTNAALATSQRFEVGLGRAYVVTANAGFHMACGDETVVATTSHTLWPAGAYLLGIPDGCTHVAIIQGSDAASGNVYPS